MRTFVTLLAAMLVTTLARATEPAVGVAAPAVPPDEALVAAGKRVFTEAPRAARRQLQ